MRPSVFDFIAPRDIEIASGRAFRIRRNYYAPKLLASIERFAPELTAELNRSNVLEMLRDTPGSRAWLNACGKVVATLDKEAHPIEVIAHLTLDQSRKERLYELLCLQLIGILAGHAARWGETLEIKIRAKLPDRLYIDGLGMLQIDEPLTDIDTSVMTVSNGRIAFDAVGGHLEVVPQTGLVTGHGAFVSAGTVALGHAKSLELPYLNPSLFRPEFQPFPQLGGERANREWARSVSAAVTCVTHSGLPSVEYIVSLCKSVIGLVSPSDSIGSASREEAMGLVYLPVTPSLLDLSECLLHEGLHQMLFRIEESVAIFEPESDKSSTFYSPWRDDGRPLRMVLHGAYVFAGVASMHKALALHPVDHFSVQGDPTTAYRRVRESLHAIETVKRHAQLTRIGRKLVEAIEADLEHSGDLPITLPERARIDAGIIEKRNAFSAYID
ncbi:aKG-HExxH-type peptide beta-hydroxylase [Paraburkholderia sp. RL17-347-BIC-D]|uniref:aKG-HExxH-type peptide beta-hydroxylase n=1 Tax=Paraburkholderia sp. RL17-347-BIC-D TaxID=3031632 RepID=UPI0038B93861